jgi:hypothetical protein
MLTTLLADSRSKNVSTLATQDHAPGQLGSSHACVAGEMSYGVDRTTVSLSQHVIKLPFLTSATCVHASKDIFWVAGTIPIGVSRYSPIIKSVCNFA